MPDLGSTEDPDFRLIVRLTPEGATLAVNLVQCRRCPDVYAVPGDKEELFRRVHSHKDDGRQRHFHVKERKEE